MERRKTLEQTIRDEITLVEASKATQVKHRFLKGESKAGFINRKKSQLRVLRFNRAYNPNRYNRLEKEMLDIMDIFNGKHFPKVYDEEKLDGFSHRLEEINWELKMRWEWYNELEEL